MPMDWSDHCVFQGPQGIPVCLNGFFGRFSVRPPSSRLARRLIDSVVAIVTVKTQPQYLQISPSLPSAPFSVNNEVDKLADKMRTKVLEEK